MVDKFIYRSETVPLIVKCRRVNSHVYSTALNDSLNWPWSGARLTKVRACKVIFHVLLFVPACFLTKAG